MTDDDWKAIQGAVDNDCPLSIVANVCMNECTWEEAASRIEAYAVAAFNRGRNGAAQ